jgi:hypothetical protein
VSISGHWVRAFGDRFLWQPLTLGFAYRFGQRGGTEVTLWGGLLHWGLGLGMGRIPNILLTRLAAAVDVRWGIGPGTAMTATAGSETDADYTWGGDGRRDDRGWGIANIVWSRAALVVHHLLSESAALNVGLRCDDEWTPSPWRAQRHHRYHVSVGSLTPLGLRRPPLVQILVGDMWSVGLHAEVSIELPSEVVRTRLLGASMWTW